MQNGLPVDFIVNVNGKQMGASLFAIENCGIHNSYRIRFEDGYEDNFWHAADVDEMDADENNELEYPHRHGREVTALELDRVYCEKEEEGLPYCMALHYELIHFANIAADTTISAFSYKLDNTSANGWLYRKKSGDSFYYSVYLHSEYFFDLFYTGKRWAARVGDEIWPEGTGHPLEAEAIRAIGDEPVVKASPSSKQIIFPLLYNYKGKHLIAQGVLINEQLTTQCIVTCVPEESDPLHTVAFCFEKVDKDGRIFDAGKGKKRYEKLTKSIAEALEKLFSVRPFSVN